MVREIRTKRDPSYPLKRAHMLEHIKAITRVYQESLSKGKFKTTGPVTVPVVFHVVLDATDQNTLGGINGIRQRAIDQIGALNRDFNKQNTDISLVPNPFQPLIGNAEIQFGLAHRKPDGTGTEGFEIITTSMSSYGGDASEAKSSQQGGADTWDPTKYLNIWVVDLGSSSNLGFTFVPFSPQPEPHDGIVLNYGAFGVRSHLSDYYAPKQIDKGRTLTHEVAHYFKLDHIWGDDNGLCPTSGGQDDGIPDTPPQASPTYGSPQISPTFDACTPSGAGIMWMNFLDYVDDASMYMFTLGQVARMKADLSPGGFSYSLTQNPELLEWPTDVTDIEKESGFNIFPNPTTGVFTISFIEVKGLQDIQVSNIMGQNVYSIKADNSGISNYNVNLTGLSKGVYMVQCTFGQGIVTRKILLQ